MEPITHFLTGACISRAGLNRKTGLSTITLTLGAYASDIDVVYLTGYGFPAWRGGPMFYADLTGLDRVLGRIREFEKEHGPRWAPAPLLVRLAEQRRTFRDYDRERRA